MARQQARLWCRWCCGVCCMLVLSYACVIQVWDLSIKMLGPKHKPFLKAKAKETEGLLPFCVELLQRHRYKFRAAGEEAQLRTDMLIAGGQAAVRFQSTMNSISGWPNTMERQNMLDSLLRHVTLCGQAGMRLLPKHHLLVHAVQRMQHQGNPKAYTTYHDEHLNGMLANMARSAHAWTFCEMAHRKYAMHVLLA